MAKESKNLIKIRNNININIDTNRSNQNSVGDKIQRDVKDKIQQIKDRIKKAD